jgi:hypothetical protein
MHSIEMEKSAIWNIRATGTGVNGKPKNMAGGLLWWTKSNASSNVNSFQYNSSYTGQTWLQGGENWLDYYLSILYRYAPSDKVIAICGDGAMLGLQNLAKNVSTMTLNQGAASYGIKITNWQTVFGNVPLKTHPLFSQMESTRNSMLLYCPQNTRFMPLRTRDTQFLTDRAEKGVDGRIEEYLTEGTFEFRFPNQFMYLEGVGLNCVV